MPLPLETFKDTLTDSFSAWDNNRSRIAIHLMVGFKIY